MRCWSGNTSRVETVTNLLACLAGQPMSRIRQIKYRPWQGVLGGIKDLNG